jgi:hypothetical protein
MKKKIVFKSAGANEESNDELTKSIKVMIGIW